MKYLLYFSGVGFVDVICFKSVLPINVLPPIWSLFSVVYPLMMWSQLFLEVLTHAYVLAVLLNFPNENNHWGGFIKLESLRQGPESAFQWAYTSKFLKYCSGAIFKCYTLSGFNQELVREMGSWWTLWNKLARVGLQLWVYSCILYYIISIETTVDLLLPIAVQLTLE